MDEGRALQRTLRLLGLSYLLCVCLYGAAAIVSWHRELVLVLGAATVYFIVCVVIPTWLVRRGRPRGALLWLAFGIEGSTVLTVLALPDF
ncbi:MAG: hypothetical protein NT062_36575, partial [Proteobacteria bacterium]|nr:hypothetical protein [Pseudomonadota bacterium]